MTFDLFYRSSRNLRKEAER